MGSERLASTWSALPVELWDAVLFCVPPSLLQRTTLSLVRALPRCQVSHAHLYRHVVIAKDDQVWTLRSRLADLGKAGKDEESSGEEGGMEGAARTMRMVAWRLKDNNVMLNLVRGFGNLRALEIFIGPVFGVDQLEELCMSPWSSRIELLSFRFNQYVSQRSYEPFLKGAYFDSSLEMLARWPRLARFRAFSFVQDQPPVYDPPDSSSAIAGHQGIAQPIVLFRFFCVSVLAASPLASSIENLRLRIPNRSLLVPLTTHQTSSTSTPATHTHATSTLAPRLFPSLRYLDISTSHLGTESAVFALVRRHRRLEHLVIDRTSLLSSDAERSLEVVRALGRLIACAGVGIAAEASRSWRSLSEQLLRTTPSEPTASTSTSTGAAPKKKMRGRSAYGSEPRWKKLAAKERQKAEAEAAAAQSNGLGARPRRPRKMPSKVVVVPSPVRLRSLCAGANDFDRLERRESDGVSRRSAMDSALRQAWNEAWSEGLDRLDEVTEEKIAEWERNARLWDAAHEASSSESDASEGDTGASSRAGDGLGRPLLVTCSPDAYDPMLPLADGADMLEAWMRSFDLAPTTPALARAAVTQASVDGPAVLCLVPDCPEKGQVMWSEAMAAQSVAAGSARVDEDMSWQKGSGRHQVGCGHLLGRRIWNADAW